MAEEWEPTRRRSIVLFGCFIGTIFSVSFPIAHAVFPTARCRATTVCLGKETAGALVGRDSSGGRHLTFEPLVAGPWSSTGTKTLKLTVTNDLNQTDSASCRVDVQVCNANHRQLEATCKDLTVCKGDRITPDDVNAKPNSDQSSDNIRKTLVNFRGPFVEPQTTVLLFEIDNDDKTTFCRTVISTKECSTRLSCPSAENEAAIIDTPPTNLIQLSRSNPGILCRLMQVSSESNLMKPLGRSYDDNDWEPYAGGFSHLSYQCRDRLCSVTLPPLPSDKYSYGLISSSHSTATFDDEIARFLEQTTFGPTRHEITSSRADSFPKWVARQQNLDPTSHREYFRKRANNKYEYPSPQGLATHACDKGTRYRKYAFSYRDGKGRTASISTSKVSRRRILKVNGQTRTVVEPPIFGISGQTVQIFGDGDFEICAESVEDRIGGSLMFEHPVGGCMEMHFGGLRGNPMVFFDKIDKPPNEALALERYTAPMDTQYYGGEAQEIIVTARIPQMACLFLPTVTGHPEHNVIGVLMASDGVTEEYWLHSPMFKLQENTLEKPMSDGGGTAVLATNSKSLDPKFQTKCSNVPRSFLNEEQCVLSANPFACTAEEIPQASKISLETSTFRKIYVETGAGVALTNTRYIYALGGELLQHLDYHDPPCVPGARSRWIPSKKSCLEAQDYARVEQETMAIFEALIRGSSDPNPYMRDIFFPYTGKACSPADREKFDFQVEVDGKCWKNVHEDYLSVYDFTEWTKDHPGNSDTHNPIKAFAEESDTFTLLYPREHRNRWSRDKERFGRLGRLGDTIYFSDLPNGLDQADIFEIFGASPFASRESTGRVLICGSPNEVANDINFGRGFAVGTRFDRPVSNNSMKQQRVSIWVDIAMKAKDQLRQRVAWVFSQILVISPASINTLIQTEDYTTYYDIFVRNAFGNYRDILKEVAYSPMMAEMLSYLKSQSTGYIWTQQRTVAYPDENFAREVMQLFSIGLDMLKQDGTKELDSEGNPIRSYTNRDITEYARAWTGFNHQRTRGNIDGMSHPSFPDNHIDPMRINIKWRDHFPKMGLNKKYVGDGLPLCTDLPKRHFLKAGATYRLLGGSSTPELQSDPADWAGDNPSRFTLNVLSPLRGKLCNKRESSGVNDPCRFPAKLVLKDDLSCYGLECDLDSLRSFEVAPGVFYEYVRPACVNLAFSGNLRLVKSRSGIAMCADQRTEVSATSCCAPRSNNAKRVESFFGERVTYDTASQRCVARGGVLCSFPNVEKCNAIGSCDLDLHYWTSRGCTQKVKIDLEGKVAMVHHAGSRALAGGRIEASVREDSKVFFRVDWLSSTDEFLADYRNQCRSMGCSFASDGLCLCDVKVSETQVFSENKWPSREQIMKKLSIGAFPDDEKPAVQILDEPTPGTYSPDTVFEVEDEFGRTVLRKNVNSVVTIGNGNLQFRNAVQFIALADPAVRDAQYETDAVLDQYFFHQNVGPFLAVRLAQRFGISNPSPRYVKTMATAFRTGVYIHTDKGETTTFGTGQYGDLGAMVAAVLLDRESRSVLLDADPFSGSVFEPFLKVIRLMRSLEFVADADRPYVQIKRDLQDFVGQEAHKMPTVFSFFKPEHEPPGPLAHAGMKSPESSIAGSKSLALLNTMLSFIKYGLNRCYDGFGYGKPGRCIVGDGGNAYGFTTYSQKTDSNARDVVNELATLLTAGRLSTEHRNMIEKIYSDTLKLKGPKIALINAQQAIVVAPEFHANGLVETTGVQRLEPKAPDQSSKPYKAVVHITLEGGLDSFNLLVPESCNGTNAKGTNLRDQYIKERGILAFEEGKERSLTVNATSSKQPCDIFAVHDELTVLKKLYDEGDLIFLANTGVINQDGATSQNYEQMTRTQLFAHNFMSAETKRVDPFDKAIGTGVLGRAADVLTDQGFSVGSFGIDLPSEILGSTGDSRPPLVVGRTGVTSFNKRPTDESDFNLENYTSTFNAETTSQSNRFSETWSHDLINTIHESRKIHESISGVKSSIDWGSVPHIAETREFWEELSMVSKLMKTHESRGADREIFAVHSGLWDHHARMKDSLRTKFQAVNFGLKLFVQELKAQGNWDKVTIIVTSEFGRTLTPNSGGGSDHGHGGHYFMMGGSVAGGKIVGEYPHDLTSDSLLNVGRGRVLPTTSWDSVWNGIAEWLGVAPENLDICLPNRQNTVNSLFPLLRERDFFL